MSDLISRDEAIASLDPDNIHPAYIVETMKTRLKELPSRVKGRKDASKATPPAPPNTSLTVLDI